MIECSWLDESLLPCEESESFSSFSCFTGIFIAATFPPIPTWDLKVARAGMLYDFFVVLAGFRARSSLPVVFEVDASLVAPEDCDFAVEEPFCLETALGGLVHARFFFGRLGGGVDVNFALLAVVVFDEDDGPAS